MADKTQIDPAVTAEQKLSERYVSEIKDSLLGIYGKENFSVIKKGEGLIDAANDYMRFIQFSSPLNRDELMRANRDFIEKMRDATGPEIKPRITGPLMSLTMLNDKITGEIRLDNSYRERGMQIAERIMFSQTIEDITLRKDMDPESLSPKEVAILKEANDFLGSMHQSNSTAKQIMDKVSDFLENSDALVSRIKQDKPEFMKELSAFNDEMHKALDSGIMEAVPVPPATAAPLPMPKR